MTHKEAQRVKREQCDARFYAFVTNVVYVSVIMIVSVIVCGLFTL